MTYGEDDVRKLARAMLRMHTHVSVPWIARKLNVEAKDLRDKLGSWPALRREFVFSGYRKCTSERYIAAMELLETARIPITDRRIACLCGTRADAVKVWRQAHRDEWRHFYVLTEFELKHAHHVTRFRWLIRRAIGQNRSLRVDDVAMMMNVDRGTVYRLMKLDAQLRAEFDDMTAAGRA